ncbi:uncharacterized protein LOC144868801 [Branchiostoma floridae x Branchiostoma japonicum]
MALGRVTLGILFFVTASKAMPQGIRNGCVPPFVLNQGAEPAKYIEDTSGKYTCTNYTGYDQYGDLCTKLIIFGKAYPRPIVDTMGTSFEEAKEKCESEKFGATIATIATMRDFISANVMKATEEYLIKHGEEHELLMAEHQSCVSRMHGQQWGHQFRACLCSPDQVRSKMAICKLPAQETHTPGGESPSP